MTFEGHLLKIIMVLKIGIIFYLMKIMRKSEMGRTSETGKMHKIFLSDSRAN